MSCTYRHQACQNRQDVSPLIASNADDNSNGRVIGLRPRLLRDMLTFYTNEATSRLLCFNTCHSSTNLAANIFSYCREIFCCQHYDSIKRMAAFVLPPSAIISAGWPKIAAAAVREQLVDTMRHIYIYFASV